MANNLIDRRFILLFGQDVRLVETRSWVLERAGYRVQTVYTLNELAALSPLKDVDLFLLCDSLSPRSCDQALLHIQSAWPKAKRLVLTSATGRHDQFAVTELTIPAIEGPRTLLVTIHNLMTDSAGPLL